jgi:uncharacterized protein (TIGR03437 family)
VNYTLPSPYTVDYTVVANTGASRNGTISITYPNTVNYTLSQDAPAPTASSASPPSLLQGTSKTVTFTGTNFFSGDTAMVSTTGVSVGSLNVLSATQASATFTIAANATLGAFPVQFFSPLGTANTNASVLQVVPPLVITAPTSLASGTVGTAYGPVNFTASGGTGGYTWSSGSGMPPGLSISSAGVLNGTPTSSGGFSPSFTVTDSQLDTTSVTLSITISPAALTAITIQTSPTGLMFSVDGGAAQTAPKTVNLSQGSHTIAVATPQAGSTGTQYVFANWSDGGAASHSITVTSSAATYTATFTTQYQLTISASPTAGGTVTPSSGSYYAAGTVVPITATANSGYTFSGWSGSVANASAASTTVTMNAPETVTGNFASQTGVTIQTNPAGRLFSVDGGAAQIAPQTLNLSQGQHTIAVATPQNGSSGTQYVFANWSDGGAASHTITVTASAATYTASFTTQYQLTISASPVAGGTVTPSSGSYYAAGTAVPITATANSGYTFSGWTGSVGNASDASTTVTMNAPQTVTANFASQAGVTIQTNPTGLMFSVDGGFAQTAPQTLNLSQGQHTIAVATPQAGSSGTQYAFASWSDGGAASHTITVTASAATYTATFTTQYRLTISASPVAGGSVTPSSGSYYSTGTVVPVVATPNTGYTFSGWSGSVGNPAAASTTVTMNAPQTVTANFSSQTGETIQTSPPGLMFSVDGGAAQTAPQTLSLSQGQHTIAVATPQAGPSGTQYVFASWSDGGAASHTITVNSSAATYTATFTTQYQLTLSASPAAGGTVTPSSGSYYATGTVVSVVATANSGYTFSGWSGSVGNAGAASTTVTMSAPQTVTANFGQSSAGGPTIASVLNNYSSTVPNAPNYGIAPGSLVVIYGANLATPGSQPVLQDPSKALPLTLNGSSVTITVNGTKIQPAFYYAIPTQLAVVIPSSTPVGTGTITVSFGGQTSAPAPITIVPSAFGFDYYDGTLAAITDNADGHLITSTKTAYPGEVIVFWGSGDGADTKNDDVDPPTHFDNLSGITALYFGDVLVPITYQGRSSYQGVDQVAVVVPADAPTGCAVSVVAVIGSGSTATVSNLVMMPIGTSEGVCTDPLTLVDPTEAATLSGNTTVKFGSISIDPSETQSVATALFDSIGGSLLNGYLSSSQPSLGSCFVTQTQSTTPPNPFNLVGLDAGSLSVTGPNGTQALASVPGSTGDYSAQLPAGFVPAAGGAFTFTGTGGKDVGAVKAALNVPDPLVWTNPSSNTTITRTQGITVTWTGGAAGTFAQITGNAVSSSPHFSASFVCNAPVAAGSFTVPESILLALPAGSGSLAVGNNTMPATFSATGLDFGFSIGFAVTSVSAVYN